MKRNSVQSEHLLDAFRMTAEKWPHEIAQPSYDHVTLLEEAYNFCDSIFGLKDKLEIGHMSVGRLFKEVKEAGSVSF